MVLNASMTNSMQNPCQWEDIENTKSSKLPRTVQLLYRTSETQKEQPKKTGEETSPVPSTPSAA